MWQMEKDGWDSPDSTIQESVFLSGKLSQVRQNDLPWKENIETYHSSSKNHAIRDKGAVFRARSPDTMQETPCVEGQQVLCKRCNLHLCDYLHMRDTEGHESKHNQIFLFPRDLGGLPMTRWSLETKCGSETARERIEARRKNTRTSERTRV